MNPTFHQQTPNYVDINSSYNKILIPQPIISPIKKVSIIKKGKELIKDKDIIQNNNLGNGLEIIKENKTIIYFPDNIQNLQNQKHDRLICNNNNNSKFIKRDDIIEIDGNTQIGNSGKNQKMNINNNIIDKNYEDLIKKIAKKLKSKVRAPTQGFFHFAFLKGEYPLIIIRKIYNSLDSHKIGFNDDIFKLYTEKYYKYRELIKRIARLLKLSKKKSGQILKNVNHEQKNIIQIIPNNNNKSISTNNNFNKINNTNIKDEININKIINNINYGIKNEKDNNININLENINQFNTSNDQGIMINNCISYMPMSNQNKAKTQVNKIKSSQYYNNFNINSYNIYNFSDKRINPINPFMVSKDKILFNNKKSKSKSYNISNNFTSINTNSKKNNSINNSKEEAKHKNSNIKLSPTPIFSEIPIDSKFAELSNDNEIDNDFQNTKLINNNSKINQISSFLSNNFVLMNKDHNLNLSKRKNTNINLINDPEYNNKIDESNISIVNNYNTDSNNNITFSSVNNEEFHNNNISLDSNKDKAKNINFKVFPFKKLNESSIEEEKINNSNIESQKINISNIKNINCNTFNGRNSSDNLIGNDLILYQKEISTSVDENSFLKKFSLFLSHNNILIQNNLPLAVSEKGQKYLKKNEFWEKYINFIYMNYEMNNEQLSLFSFIHIIEQYFLWCENLNEEIISDFKKLIIDIINKIYDLEKIKKFCFMNKIQNLEELFEKYKNFRKINNNSDDYNHRYHREVEIKIDNEVQCNCDLCKNENSYMKNLIEINKSLITGVNIDSLSYKSNKQKDIVLPFKNDHISYNPETKDPINNSIFNKNKTLHSFVTEYECIADKNDDNKKRTKKSISQIIEINEPFKDEKNGKIDNYFIKKEDKEKKKKKKKRNKSYNLEEEIDFENESEEEEKSKKKKTIKKSSKKGKEKKYN